jgi:murein DD-endopeptidase MepM/ murein hydrolase activator NlpD
VSPITVERLAALPRQPWLAGHRGIDLEAAIGDVVTAPGSGVVSFAGFVVDRPVLSITHDHGLVTSLEPVSATVAVGDPVVVGQEVGIVDAARSHCAPGVCVHWGLRLNGEYVDPLDYLDGFGPIRLLPLTNELRVQTI